MLSFGFEASLLIGSARQGEISRRLAGWAAILAVPTAIAGIYGMNFRFMPELTWRYGYPMALGLIVVICALLWWRFRRIRWL
jgi:magnesium transporter